MRILIFGINFAPERTGIGKYTGEMCSWLAAQGHEVSMVTAHPYYPEWRIHPGYRGRGWVKEHLAGVKVYRVPLYVPKQTSSKKRVLHELSFFLSLVPAWLRVLLNRKYDVVININPPFHLGYFPWSYAKLRGAKLVTHVQDLQVDVAKELGMINNGRLLKLMFRAERFLLRQSDAVSSISIGMKQKILAKGIPEEKFVLFPNWVDELAIRPMAVTDSLRMDWGIPAESKVVLYSGNLGEKQGLEILVESAKQFKDRTDVHFVICGSGSARKQLKGSARAAELERFHFLPLQPYEKLPALLAAADIHLVLQKKSISDLMMPSKLTSILAAGGFSIVSAVPGSSLYDVMETNDLGMVIEPESVDTLTEALHQALNMDLDPYRKRARAYAERYLGKTPLLETFERNLLKLLNYGL